MFFINFVPKVKYERGCLKLKTSGTTYIVTLRPIAEDWNFQVKLTFEDGKHSRFIPQKPNLLFRKLEETDNIKAGEYAGEVISFYATGAGTSITFFP